MARVGQLLSDRGCYRPTRWKPVFERASSAIKQFLSRPGTGAINPDTRSVIVAYRTGADIIKEIQTRQPAPDEKRFDKRDLRDLQRYMVNVVRRDFDLLPGQKHLRELLPNLDLHVLKSGHYHSDLGLLVNRARPLEDYLQ